MGVYGRVFLGGESNGGIGKAVLWHHGGVHVLLHLRAVVGSGCVIHQIKGLETLIQDIVLDNPIDPILEPDSGYEFGSFA